MTGCDVLGHAWRSAAATQANGIRWTTWLCARCPATIEYAWAWGRPQRGGLFTRADVALIAFALGAAGFIVLAGGAL